MTPPRPGCFLAAGYDGCSASPGATTEVAEAAFEFGTLDPQGQRIAVTARFWATAPGPDQRPPLLAFRLLTQQGQPVEARADGDYAAGSGAILRVEQAAFRWPRLCWLAQRQMFGGDPQPCRFATHCPGSDHCGAAASAPADHPSRP